jgi:hypothetical protein
LVMGLTVLELAVLELAVLTPEHFWFVKAE